MPRIKNIVNNIFLLLNFFAINSEKIKEKKYTNTVAFSITPSSSVKFL